MLAYFKINKLNKHSVSKNSGKQEKESIIRVRVQDHRLSSLGKPRDAKRRSSERIFLSYFHTHDEFLYSAGQRLNSGSYDGNLTIVDHLLWHQITSINY